MDENLLNLDNIILDSSSKTKQQAFFEMASLAKKMGYITNKNDLVSSFLEREKISTTGFKAGIAIPHAQNDSIIKPAILVSRYKTSISWNSVDGSSVKVAIAIILPKSKVEELHIDILKNVSLKLLNKEFVNELKITNSKEWIKKNYLQ